MLAVARTQKHQLPPSLRRPRKYTCRVAKTLKEDKELIEAGFEYVTQLDGLKIYHKRK
jgi:hypothetical protein